MDNESVTVRDIQVSGLHHITCTCEICERVRKFRKELNETTRWILTTKD